MIKASSRLIVLLLFSMTLALLPVIISQSLWVVWLGYLITLFLLILIESFELLQSSKKVTLKTETPNLLYIGLKDEIHFTIENIPDWEAFKGKIYIDCNEILSKVTESCPFNVEEKKKLILPLRPLRRGTARVETVTLLWQSRFGLLSFVKKVELNKKIAVVSDFKSLKRLAIEFFGSRDITTGLKIEKYVGEGSEFDRLKEYLPGMDHRTIDWKASARHNKLLNREFRAERNHQILLAYDSGYLMGESIEGIPKLDHAINNSLFLSYVSLQVGDRVGLFSFNEKMQTFWEPRGGLQHFHTFKKATGSIEYTNKDTNFTRSFAELSYKLHSRALIVVFTDFIDSISAELMVENITRIGKKHLIMFISMKDTKATELIEQRPIHAEAVSQSVITYEMELEREVVLNKLRKKGILVINVEPHKLTGEIINHYLRIKRREMIS